MNERKGVCKGKVGQILREEKRGEEGGEVTSFLSWLGLQYS